MTKEKDSRAGSDKHWRARGKANKRDTIAGKLAEDKPDFFFHKNNPLKAEEQKRQKQKLELNGKIVRRPANYHPNMPHLMINHCNVDKYYYEQKNKVTGKMEKTAVDFPTIQSFRVKHKIPATTFNHWLKQYPEMQEAYEIVKDIQRDFLIQNGLNGTYNSNIVKFVGGNELDMAEKKEVVHKDAGINESQKRKIIWEYLSSLPNGWVIDVEEVPQQHLSDQEVYE